MLVIQTDPLDNELYVLANEVGDSDAMVREFDDPRTCGRRQSSNLHGLRAEAGWVWAFLKFQADKMKALKLSEETRARSSERSFPTARRLRRV